jgi:hypothetical protein
MCEWIERIAKIVIKNALNAFRKFGVNVFEQIIIESISKI